MIIQITPKDNVAVAVEPVKSGQAQSGITAVDDIHFGHKIALFDIKQGENIIKYGYPIGHATTDIPAGAHVHTHNLRTNLAGQVAYNYAPDSSPCTAPKTGLEYFQGYMCKNGKTGTRNELWIIPTVGCVNKTAEQIAARAKAKLAHLLGNGIDDIIAATHPYGCSQMGDDQTHTQLLLAGLARHPNAAGVLVLSLGCENNNLEAFTRFLGDFDTETTKFITTQDCQDELTLGVEYICQLAETAKNQKRQPVHVSNLTIGFKCGGSDAFSGITANPLCGGITNIITNLGGSAILTEVPEMFGAETILLNRARDKQVFDKAAGMVNGYKSYFEAHNQVVYENPSPGNKAGGITTLEEKSLGCIQKGGQAVVNDVLGYAEPLSRKGLNLLDGPGNDIVSTSNLAAAGAQIIVFTTGRGTPLGALVPTIKLSTNANLTQAKPNWIDFCASPVLSNPDFDALSADFYSYIIEVASGRKTKNEENGYKEIAIFKNGVTL